MLQVGHDVCVYDPTPLTVLFLGLRSNGSNNISTKPISTNNNNIICLIVCLILWVLDYISSFYATTPQQKRGQATINTFLYAFCHRNSYYFSLFLVKHNGHYIGCVWMHAGGKHAEEDEESPGNNPGTNRIETIPIFVKRCGLLHD